MRITRTAPLATSFTSTAFCVTTPRLTLTTCSWPPLRRITRFSGPRRGDCRAVRAVSTCPRTRCPSTASSVSPLRRPARAAGDFGTTPTISSDVPQRAHPQADAVEGLTVSALSAAYSRGREVARERVAQLRDQLRHRVRGRERIGIELVHVAIDEHLAHGIGQDGRPAATCGAGLSPPRLVA